MREYRRLLWLISILWMLTGCKNTAKSDYLIHGIGKEMTYGVAVMMGSVHDKYVTDYFPNARTDRFETVSDQLMALESGKSDIVISDETIYKITYAKSGKYNVIERIFSEDLGLGFHLDNTALRNAFNHFLGSIKSDGIYDQMLSRWFDNYENARMPDLGEAPEGKPLRIGTLGSMEGFAFMQDGALAGFDIEILERFGRFVNRPVEYNLINLTGLIAAVASGKVDIIASGITITEERSKQIAFSDSYFKSHSIALVMKDRDGKADRVYHSMNDIKDKRIGVLMSSTQDQYITQTYPGASVLRIDLTPDLVMALKTKQCDAIVLPHPVAGAILKEDSGLGLLEEDIYPVELGVGFGRSKMRDEFNVFLAEIKRNGLYNDIERRWMDSTQTAEMPVLDVPLGAKPIVVGTSAESLPFTFIKNGANCGLDIELVARFAASKGRPVEYRILTFGGLIPAIVSGKIDLMASSAMMTEERKKQIAFSDPYYTIKSNVIALNENLNHAIVPVVEKKSFVQQIEDSFYNNLVKEKRYKLILDGLWQTVIITFFSVILGTIFGSVICFLRMSKHLAFQSFAKAYISVMRGTPILVLLMIFFYVVFATSGLNATVVAIFTFSLNMAAYSSEMFRTAIEGIDRGQKEAGIALGFTTLQTYIYIILPQAIRNVLPVYKGEVISLLKTTSIVGYIAVVDLTKASDIIRSRTFDAFFPLIIVAVIYFLLAWLLGLGLDCFNKKISSTK